MNTNIQTKLDLILFWAIPFLLVWVAIYTITFLFFKKKKKTWRELAEEIAVSKTKGLATTCGASILFIVGYLFFMGTVPHDILLIRFSNVWHTVGYLLSLFAIAYIHTSEFGTKKVHPGLLALSLLFFKSVGDLVFSSWSTIFPILWESVFPSGNKPIYMAPMNPEEERRLLGSGGAGPSRITEDAFGDDEDMMNIQREMDEAGPSNREKRRKTEIASTSPEVPVNPSPPPEDLNIISAAVSDTPRVFVLSPLRRASYAPFFDLEPLAPNFQGEEARLRGQHLLRSLFEKTMRLAPELLEPVSFDEYDGNWSLHHSQNNGILLSNKVEIKPWTPEVLADTLKRVPQEEIDPQDNESRYLDNYLTSYQKVEETFSNLEYLFENAKILNEHLEKPENSHMLQNSSIQQFVGQAIYRCEKRLSRLEMNIPLELRERISQNKILEINEQRLEHYKNKLGALEQTKMRTYQSIENRYGTDTVPDVWFSIEDQNIIITTDHMNQPAVHFWLDRTNSVELLFNIRREGMNPSLVELLQNHFERNRADVNQRLEDFLVNEFNAIRTHAEEVISMCEKRFEDFNSAKAFLAPLGDHVTNALNFESLEFIPEEYQLPLELQNALEHLERLQNSLPAILELFPRPNSDESSGSGG